MSKFLNQILIQYGCICEGTFEINGELNSAEGREVVFTSKDILNFYYGNCTVISRSVMVQDLGQDFHLDDIFNDIEEVYGFIDFSRNLELTEVRFKNLGIIRGWFQGDTEFSNFQAKLGYRGKLPSF